MKQLLLICAVVALVGCGTISETNQNVPEKLIADPIVEKEIRERLKKSTGELTEADLEKVTHLDLRGTEITDEGLKDAAKLQKLTSLYLNDTQVTKAGVAQLKKALPKCNILSP